MGSPGIEMKETAVAGALATVVAGEVDVGTAPALISRLEEAVRRTDGLLGREDRRLMIMCPPGQVRRVLELTGILEMFALYDSPEEVARALARR